MIHEERFNENGYHLLVGYHTTDSLIVAKVERQLTLKVDGKVVRRLEASYLEWFQMGTLPDDPSPWSAEEWARLKPFAKKNFFFADEIKAGPQGVAAPPPDNFVVEIRTKHEFFTGVRLNAAGPGKPQTFGNYGYLDAGPKNAAPSFRRIEGTTATDQSAEWRQQQAQNGEPVPTGNIADEGTKVLTLIIEHDASWQRPAEQTRWAVDWRYRRTFEPGDTRNESGSAADTVPRTGP